MGKMLKKIKNLAKKSQTILKIHKSWKFFKEIPLKDFLDLKKLRLILKVKPYTMISYLRLSNAYCLAKLAEENGSRGAFVECGVWKGGCVALMGFVAEQAKSGRKIWLFDSFEGLPAPGKKDTADKDGVSPEDHTNKCIASMEDVEKIFFSILKLNRKNIVIRKGWFENTIPGAEKEIGPIAILRLDADWYESTKGCLDNLYDRVISGGYVIIDDYGFWEGCKKAVDEFLERRKLNVNLINIDKEGVYFQKLQ